VLLVLSARVPYFRETRRPLSPEWSGQHPLLVSARYGVSFALGWTPLVTPLLMAALLLALHDPDDALPFAWGFASGMYLPFLAFSANLKGASEWVAKNPVDPQWFALLLGAVLFIVGILIGTDGLGIVPQSVVHTWLDF
jgi:cytochrome c biogenesis protein CcdA